MATQTVAGMAAADDASSRTFERFAGICAIVTGVLGFLYSIAFVFISELWLYSLLLMLGGLVALPVIVALFQRLRRTDASFALLGLLLGLAGALGAAIHGAYDLSTALNPPKADVIKDAGLPFLVDPRGMLTFGVAGLGVFVVAWLMMRNTFFGKYLAYLGYVLGVLLVVIYLARLTIVDAKSPAVLGPAAAAGFIANPIWYIWLGLLFWRGKGLMGS
jgi:hypothetical protein